MKKGALSTLVIILFCALSYGQTPTYDDILIPMSDGESLSADVYLPTGPGPFEVVLIQTPYNKDNIGIWLPMGVGQNINGQPFAWVIVDWRGFYGSSGAAAGPTNGEDGYDVCDWIVAQTWHGDRIGTWGPSALGGVQYNTAQEHHPNHTCAVPLVAHPHQSYDAYFYGGVLEEARLQQLDALGYGLSPIIMANTYYNNTWAFSENSTWNPSGIEIPTLQIGGWYDHNIDKMMDWYEATRTSALASVQDQQWLLVGPWVHGGTGTANVGTTNQGELNYANAEKISDTMAWNFLNYYLLDAPNSWDTTSMITYYEMGNDVWHTTNNATIDIATNDVLYLDQNEKLISGNGASSSSFICDPNNPSPTLGGATLNIALDQGPYNQTSLLSRNDLTPFSTEVLPEDVSVTGRIGLDLYIESDQPDGDIAVRLIDEYPDGRNMLITDGIRRMRFRNGYTQSDEVFMSPGQVYPIHIDLPFTNYTWLAGHKLKIIVSGNHASRWNVNLQNGGAMYTAGTANTANISIHHNGTYPSSITLPGNNPILAVEKLEDKKVNLYPNPANGVIKIETDQTFETYRIYDLQGRLIMTSVFTIPEINIEQLNNGNYILELNNGNDLYRSKFVKQ